MEDNTQKHQTIKCKKIKVKMHDQSQKQKQKLYVTVKRLVRKWSTDNGQVRKRVKKKQFANKLTFNLLSTFKYVKCYLVSHTC